MGKQARARGIDREATATTESRRASTTRRGHVSGPGNREAGRRLRAGGAGVPGLGNQARLRARARAEGEELQVTAPDHASEREADAIAAEVVRALAAGSAAAPRPSPVAAMIQRKAAAPGGQAAAVPGPIAGALRGASTGGTPLAPPLRRPLERAFGADLGAVRLHDDSRAHALSDALQARAFTRERDVYFARGAFDPGSPRGLHLLAHELTHVLQQRRGPPGLIQRYAAVPSSAGPDDPISFTWSGSNTFEHQIEGDHEFLRSAPEEGVDLAANLATTETTAGVTLNISGGGQLAVEALSKDKQAKAYYSTEAMLTESNTKLEVAGSSFRMRAHSNHTVTVRTGGGTHELTKVYPENVETPTSNIRTPRPDQTTVTAGPDRMLSRQQCIDLASAVIGVHGGGVGTVGVVEAFDSTDVRLKTSGRILRSSAIAGVMEAVSRHHGKIKDTRDIIRDSAPSSTEAATLSGELLPIFDDLIASLAGGRAPQTATSDFVHACLGYARDDEVPEFAKLIALAKKTDALWLTDNLPDVLEALHHYGLYLILKYDADRAGRLAELSGIQEHARPEIGETYKITYLEQGQDDWNFHWGGVVARDGDDAVTLENYTRGVGKEIKYRDPRWYFQMYGTGDQSYHAYHTTSDRLTLTQAIRKATADDVTAAPVLGPADEASRRFVADLVRIREALIAGSGDRKTNAAYQECLSLLRQCALLAVEARGDTDLYARVVETIDLLKDKSLEAKSTKGVLDRMGRNEALETLRGELRALRARILDTQLRLYLSGH